MEGVFENLQNLSLVTETVKKIQIKKISLPLPLVPTMATLFPAGTVKEAPSRIFLSGTYLEEIKSFGHLK
jgi:hypothetical protein